jgi:hypothetical protein
MSDRTLSASVNHGKPAVAASAKPNAYAGQSGMKSGTATSTDRAPAESRPPVHAADIPAIAHKPAPSSGEPEKDKVNQRHQDQLSDNQEKQRQDLQKQQADDHTRAAKQPSASGNGEELEKQHQAQTQALAQRHASEQKSLSETQQQKTPDPKREPTHGEKQP